MRFLRWRTACVVARLHDGQRPFGGSLHPIGAAIDIDQARRNHLIRGKRYPDGVNEAAARCGLMHGDRTAWPRHPDYGHFQVIGVSRGNWRARRDAVARASQTPAPTTSGSSLDVR